MASVLPPGLAVPHPILHPNPRIQKGGLQMGKFDYGEVLMYLREKY